jgi:AraC-like DNA-binding protein
VTLVAVVVPLRSSSADVDGRLSLYRELPPPAGLSTVVRCTWEGVPGWARTMRVLPDGCVDIAWDGRRVSIVNAGAVPLWLPLAASGVSVGVRLRSGVAGGLLGPGLASAEAAVVDLGDLVPSGAWVREELLAAVTPAARRLVLERFVAWRLRNGFEPDAAMLAAARALAVPAARVEVVADRIGVSARTLRRRMREAVGCRPKELHRVLRFQRFLGRLGDLAAGGSVLSSVAADLGFADQSHLGHDCVSLSGSSPAQLVASYARHAAVAETDQTSRS